MPERRCLGCGARLPKAALARFTAVPDASGHRLARDDASRLSGRGLYVCRRDACFERAVTRRAFHRAARVSGGLMIDTSLAAEFGGEGERGT